MLYVPKWYENRINCRSSRLGLIQKFRKGWGRGGVRRQNQLFSKMRPAKGICAPTESLYSVLLTKYFQIVNERGGGGSGPLDPSLNSAPTRGILYLKIQIYILSYPCTKRQNLHHSLKMDYSIHMCTCSSYASP